MLMRPQDCLTLEELAQLKSNCKTFRERAILLTLAGTGIRVNELANLKVKNIDFARGYLNIEIDKGGQPRTCIMPMPVLEAIRAHLQDRQIGYVFEGRQGGHLSTRQVQRIVDEIAQRAGLQDEHLVKQRNRKRISQHLLRYSAASWWLDRGMHIGDVAGQLGLRSLQIKGKYMERLHTNRRASIERAAMNEVLMVETRNELNENSIVKDKLKEVRQAEIEENVHHAAGQPILAELRMSWSKIIYED
jgi:integrase